MTPSCRIVFSPPTPSCRIVFSPPQYFPLRYKGRRQMSSPFRRSTQSQTLTAPNMNPSFFDVVENFLKKECKRITVNDIDKAIDTMNDAYSYTELVMTSKATNLDFNDRAYRAAYIYRYFTCIAGAVTNMWLNFSEENFLNLWLRSAAGKEVKFCSVGGGPGTDLIGFYTFMRHLSMDIKLRATILDHSCQWDSAVSYLCNFFDVSHNYELSNYEYIYFDFLQGYTTDALHQIRSADVISVVKFVSAVSADYNFCQHRLKELLSHVKPGALVFYMDNADGDIFKLISDAAKMTDFHEVTRLEYVTMSVSDHDMFRMDAWDGYFSSMPQTSTKFSACLWQKMETPFYDNPLYSPF